MEPIGVWQRPRLSLLTGLTIVLQTSGDTHVPTCPDMLGPKRRGNASRVSNGGKWEKMRGDMHVPNGLQWGKMGKNSLCEVCHLLYF